MNTIYKPKGAAAEYGDYAVNIYTGCPHRCYYCFAPQVLHRDREAFHFCVEPRKDIVSELRRKLEREQITGKLVHLCFTCDPYPTGCDTATTVKCRGVNTWVSFEPVLDPAAVLDCIKGCAYFIDRVKIGKLNYHPSDIDWAKFGREAVAACEEMGLDCYIKESLRAEVDKQ